MLKKILVIAVSTFFAANLSAANLKIGVVNTTSVMSKAPQLKAIGDKLQSQFKSQQDELKALSNKLKELQEKAQRDQLTLTTDQKVDMQRRAESLSSELKLKDNYLKQDVKYAQAKERDKLLQKVQKAIEQVAKKEKLDLVIAKEAVLYNGISLDITDKVLAIVSNPAG